MSDPNRITPEGDTIADLVMKIRYDLTNAQAKLTDLIAALDELRGEKVPPQRTTSINGPVTAPACEECGCAPGVHTGDCSQRLSLAR